MGKGRYRQIARFDFEGCDFHALPYFISFALAFQKVMDVIFRMPLESFHFDL
jgi:hypothetical protein